MYGYHTPKHFIVMACDSKKHVMSTELNIGKKIAGLELMTLNREQM